MSICHAQLQEMIKSNARRRSLRERPGGTGIGWRILEVSFGVWQAAVVALCALIAIFG